MKDKNNLLIGLVVVILLLTVCQSFGMMKGKYHRGDKGPQMLYVQSAGSGTFVASGDEYTLTLNDVDPGTVYFSDRPYRIAGNESTADFVAAWAEGSDSFKEDPPNAAIRLHEGGENADTLIVELMSPQYDASAGTLSYTVRMLDGEKGNLMHLMKDADDSLPASFEDVSLFIDNHNGHICMPRPLCLDWSV